MGVTSERHRWHQCVEWTNKKLGMALGALFIRDNFDPTAKVSLRSLGGICMLTPLSSLTKAPLLILFSRKIVLRLFVFLITSFVC